MNISIKNLVFYGVAITIIVVIAAWATVSNNNSTSDSKKLNVSADNVLVIPEQKFDFGTISMEKGKVSHTFEVKNSGSNTVTIEKVSTSCMCTSASITDNTGKTFGSFGMSGHGNGPSKVDILVNPNETVKVEAIFDPAAHGPSGVGSINRSIYLETNSTQSPKIELQLNAVVTK